MRISWKDPAAIAPGTQGIVRQQPPDGAARGSDFLGTETVGHFSSEFAEAVATERHVAIHGTFACHGHDQRTGGGFDRQWSTTARPILEPITAFGHKTGEPTADGSSAHLLLARQSAATQAGRVAQDHSSPTDQTLRGRAC